MRRSLLLLMIIGITSLSIMACGLIGFAQVESEPSPLENQDEAATDAMESRHQPEQPRQPETPKQAEEVESESQMQQPAAAPTVDPVASAKRCLAKTWEIAGLSDYVMAAIPPELAAEYDLEYKETSGDAQFHLTEDGVIVLLANDLRMEFSAQAYVFSVPVTVRLDGTATGNYTTDGQILTITNVDTSGLHASAQALGEDLIDPGQIMRSIPFISPPYNTANYVCQGDRLTLELSGYSGNIPPLVFQAVE